MKSGDEMADIFGDIPEALENTLKIAEASSSSSLTDPIKSTRSPDVKWVKLSNHFELILNEYNLEDSENRVRTINSEVDVDVDENNEVLKHYNIDVKTNILNRVFKILFEQLIQKYLN